MPVGANLNQALTTLRNTVRIAPPSGQAYLLAGGAGAVIVVVLVDDISW